MSVYLVIDWLVPREHGAETDSGLAAVRAHIVAEHPEIRSVRVIRELAEDLSPTKYRWEERYDCLADSQCVALSEQCDEVWLQVWHAAVPGSHRQGIWDDGGRPDWLTPTPTSSS
jgi:hypothetical protein